MIMTCNRGWGYRFSMVGMLVLGTMVQTAFAYEHFTVESASFGDGNFSYRLTMHDDPFLMYDDTLGFSVAATGVVSATVTPPGWSVEVKPAEVFWYSNYQPNLTNHMPRPASYDFGFQSAFTSHRLDAWGSVVYGSLIPDTAISGGAVISMNMVYYVTLAAVVPCREVEADGSPASHRETYEMFPNVEIESFHFEGKQRQGLNVRFDYADYTGAVKARRSFSDEWAEVARFSGSAGLTTWIADRPLSEYGDFFRVALVSMPGVFSATVPETPVSGKGALLSTGTTADQATLPFKLTRLSDGRVRVTFETEAGKVYRVQLCALPRGGITEQRIDGTGERVEVVFDAPPAAASVRVSKLD